MAALAYLSLIFHVELDQLGQGRELLASVQVVEVAGVLENASSVAQIIRSNRISRSKTMFETTDLMA